MKKLLILIVLSLNCEGIFEDAKCIDVSIGEKWDYQYDIDVSIEDSDDVLAYVDDTIIYKDDGSARDYWQLPEETVEKGTGDCEDYCILFMYLLYSKLGIESELVGLRDGDTGHTMVYIPSNPERHRYYEVVGGWGQSIPIVRYEVLWYCPYAEVMWMTSKYHTAVGSYCTEYL